MTDSNDSKKKSMSQVIAGCIRPTKATTKRSPHSVPDPTRSTTGSKRKAPPPPPPPPPPRPNTSSDANVPRMTRHVHGQPQSNNEKSKSDNNDSEYPNQDNDEQPSLCQKSNNGKRTKLHPSRDTDEIRKIQADIAMAEAKRVEARNRVAALDHEINEAKAELMAINANNNENRRETQEYLVRCDEKDLFMMRNIAAKREENVSKLLKSLKLQLRRALRRPVTIRTGVDKRVVVRRESGIVYLPDHRRIGMVRAGSFRHIRLVQIDKERVRLKDIPVAGDFAPKLEKAWAIHSDDISKKQFFKELVKLLPSLSKKLLKNAWLALNMHYEGKNETTGSAAADDMSHQQGIYMPFTMLLMAATVDDGSVNSSFKAGQDVYSSLSIAYKDDGSFHERKLVIMPSAAVTLYPGWDAFGMMEIKRSTQSNNDGNRLMEYDRCVLMTAVTAVALKRYIHESDYDKIALPFIIWSGYYASLYVTRLDENGNPMVSSVGYPSGGDGRVHDLSQSPCAARTKLFLAFAVLLHEFKRFFETSIKSSYYETIQKCIPLLERMMEYTPTVLTANYNSARRIDQDSTMGCNLARDTSHNAQGTGNAPMDSELARSRTCSHALQSLAYEVEIIASNTSNLATRNDSLQQDTREGSLTTSALALGAANRKDN